MKRLGFLIVCLATLLVAPMSALCAESTPLSIVLRSLHGNDGFKDAVVTLQGKVIQKVIVDINHDGKPDMVIHYKNGFRDYASGDMDADGKMDTWVNYYFTGVPWKIAEDYDRDGNPDYWIFLKNGVPYRWEQDRNGDTQVDIVTMLDEKTGKVVLQRLDDNFDGVLDKRSPQAGWTGLKPQALQQASTR